ncbi:uncharacterized protein LOC134816455 isoform X3 [Bolinopsis microptera]|uniref:uncharacterized protein LOC134816455 isoform X3 n=1 Tax=Bolinopsis microptera TaxID=2820187 RepID=UPI00307A2204
MGYYEISSLIILVLLVGDIQAACPAGTFLRGDQCLVCSAGYYESGGTCEACPLDQYNDAEQATECKACPGGKKTLEIGSDAESKCIDLCEIPATYNAGYRVASKQGLYSVSSQDRVAYNTKLVFVCSPGYQYDNTNTNKLEKTCSADVGELPSFCIRLEASQEGETYLVSTQEKSVTVSCQVFPLEQSKYASVHFFKDDVKKTQDPVVLVASSDHKSASYTVQEEGTWRCGLADDITGDINKPVSDAVVSKLTLTMEKPDELAVSTAEYSISCVASYLDTMALPELTLTLNGNAVTGTTSNIDGSTYRISTLFATPSSGIAGEYTCNSKWKITDGVVISESQLKQTVDFLGFKTEYPGGEDGTSAEKIIASKDTDFTLLCETFPVSGTQPTVKFFVDGSETAASAGNSLAVTATGEKTVYCTATVGSQTVTSKTMTLVPTELTVELTPALVYGTVGDTLTLTCSMKGDNVELFIQQFSTAVLNTYVDGSNTFTKDSADVDDTGASKFDITISKTNTWARCGMYILSEGLHFYSDPIRIYYRESTVSPDYLVLLAGGSSSFTLQVYGDPSQVTASNPEIQTNKITDKSSDWMTYYEVPVTSAKTKWYGPLDFTITYTSDKDTDVKETKLYVTDVSLSAYSENVAAAQDIVLICSHVNPPVYNLPSVTWTKGELVIEDSARVEITNGKDETTLKIKSVEESDTGLYKCAVDFKNKTDVVMFQKTSDSVQQNVVGEAYFSDSEAWMGQQVNALFRISCHVHYSRPSNSAAPKIGVQCQDSGLEGWVTKEEKTTSKTDKKFTELFDVTMVETMNNNDCRCFGEFYDAVLEPYEISSPLTRVFAYAVKRLPGSDEKHFSMISHSVTMKCSANGNGTLPIQWKKGDTKLSGSKYTVTGEEPIDGVYTSTLVITQITADMDGGYACYVAYEVDTQLQADFNLHVLHIEEFSTSIRYENEGSSVSLTCKVSQIEDKVPTVTWDQEGTTKEGCDTSIVRGGTLDCVHVLTITAQLERSVSCSAEYRGQPSLKGQSQKSGAVTVISQRVWSDQSKVTVVDGETAEYVCYGSGNQNAMRATLNYPGNPTAIKENIGTYEAKFTFVMAKITNDKEGEYQCELNFATPVQLAVTVEIMRLTEGFPSETTFQTVDKVQSFTCATDLMGDNTNAKIRFDGGPSADPNLFKYFDTEGEASSTLILQPITETMNMKEYNCSVEIKGSDADGDLTSKGLFVVQFVKLEKKSYFGVDKQPLSIPCVASGRKAHVEQISWTFSPDGSKNTGDKQAYMTQSFSLKSVLTQDLSPEKDGDYTCSVPYETYPHQDVLNIKVLKIEENPTSNNYLQVGDAATISCTGSAHGHTVVPTFLWNYVSDINTDKQETCNTQYNPNSAGELPTPTNSKGVSTIQHSIVQSDHLRSVDCTMSWSGTDADGSLTTTPALIVVTYIDAQDEVYVIEGQDGKITCMAYGPDSVDFTWWYKQNEDSSAFSKLTQGGDYDITKTNWDSTCHKRSSTLTVKTSAASHEGKYKCKTSDNEVTTRDMEKEILLKVYRVVEFKTDKEGEITQFDAASLACIASYPGGKFNFIKKIDGKDPEIQYSDYEVETDVSEGYEDKSFLTDKWVAAGWNIQTFDVDDTGEYECKVEWNGDAAPVKKLDLEISLVCQRPDITNGKLLTDDPDTVWIKKGESGTVTCESGFTLSGESSVNCVDGQLKTPTGGSLTAQCLAVPEKRCVVLPAPTNGRLNCVMRAGNLACSVVCNTGFLISDASDNEYTCTANSGENWDHVDATNPLGKTATCDKLTTRIYTYTIDDQDCSAINTAYESQCDVDCKGVLKELNCDETAGTTITIKSLKSSTEVLQALEGLTASDNGRKRRQAGSSRFTFVSDQSSCESSGSALSGEYCVECSAGYYSSNNKCKRCAVGAYSNLPGQTECTECTGDLSTLGEGASHSSECIEVCLIPGVNQGSSYPPEDYTVPAGTTLTLTCNTGYDLEYNQADEIECADELPKCYRRCSVESPEYDNNGLKKVEIGSSFIDKVQQPSALCGGRDVKCTGGNSPSIVHGFPIKAVCVDVKAMENGKTEQILYCQENVLFSFPDCSECKTGCSETQWQCNSDCSCIDNSKRCDGEDNCKVNSNKPWISDEYDCPVDITSPQGIQFDHWQQEDSSIEPVIFNYNQEKDWKQFATCLWLQTSYKGPQTVFSYGGKISMSVHDQLLAVHFNFDSTISTFSNTASGISDGDYHRICLSWNSIGGVVDLYYGDRDIINDEDFKTWSVSAKTLPAGDVVNLAVGGTEADKSNSFHGFIKDMSVMQKQLIKEDIDNFRYCKFPAEDSTRIEWSKILTQAKSKATKYYIMEYNYGGCSAPTCETSCPVNMFTCGSCDCVSPWQRCDLFTQHCIDNSDENDCKKTNGVFKPYNNQQDYENSGRKCVTEGGYLASIDSDFENELSANSLEIDDIRTAWIGTRVVKGKALSNWVSGAPKSQWAVSYYTDTTKVDKFVGLKNDKNWLPIYGLFSDNLPYLCRTQGYLIAKLDESPLSVEDWRAKCTAANDMTHFTLAEAHYSDRAESVLQSRALHKSDGWEGVAWAKSRLTCDYMRSDGSNPAECATYWNIPSFCGVQVELEQVTQAALSGEQDSYFLWNNPWNDKLSSDGTSELSLCFNVKSAGEVGTVLRYSAGSYQNEILVLLSSKSKHAPLDILEFTVHNRVNFFGVQLLDGVWHSVCIAWQTATGPSNDQGTVKLVVDGEAISTDKTLAVWPKNLYNAKLNNTGVLYVGRQGDASYSGTTSTTLKGSIMNLNVWKKLLSADEMKQMTKKTSDSFKCGPIVVQEPNLILRWRDLLHYSSSGVKISTTPDHQHCGVLRYGTPFRAGDVIEEGKVGEELIKLKSADGKDKQAVRFGDTVRILKNSLNNWMVKCETSQCSFSQCSKDDPCGTTFVVSSDKWEIGRAVAITDDTFLRWKNEDGVVMAKTVKGLTGTGEDLTLDDQINTFNVAVDKQGWTTSESGDCGEDCQKLIKRECVGGTAGDAVCPGDKDIKQYCQCPTQSGCTAPEGESPFSGVYTWRNYQDGYFALCPYGSFMTRFLPLTVIALCDTDNNAAKYDNATCSFQSEAAQELYKILYSETIISDENVEDIASQTSVAISKADDLGTVHVNLAADISTNITKVDNITEGVVNSVLDVFDTLTITVSDEDIVSSKKASNGPKKLVDSIESAAKKMRPEAGKEITLKKKSVGIKVMDIPDTQIGSVSFSLSKKASTPIDEVDFSTDNLDTEGNKKRTGHMTRQGGNGSTLNDTPAELTDVVEETPMTVSIEIAGDVARMTKQLSFMVYNNSKMFIASREHVVVADAIGNPFETGTLSIMSSVLGGSVDAETAAETTNIDSKTKRTTPVATLTMSAQGGVDKDRTPYCVYWDDAAQMWSQTGLQITSCNPSGVSCSSDHLTNFAVLMNVGNNSFSPAHQTAMTVLTITGSSLSILCLTLTVVGLAIGKMRRNPTYHIHLCLALTLGLAMLVFLVGLDRRENFVVCKVFAVLIHYMFLSSICWMLVEGVNLYIALIIVFGVNHKKLKIAAHCFSWGFPALICLITVLTDAFVAGFELYEVCMTAKYCFLNHRGRMYFFVAPIMLMMAVNIFIFVRVIIVLAKATKNRDGWTDLRQVTVIASITGISWVFGAMTVGGSVGTLVFNYLYIILNSFQGIVIFYFHCFGKPDVRNAWTEKLSTGTSRFMTSSNNSAGAPASYGKVEMPIMKARPRNEVVANKAARGETTNMTSAELSLLEESSQGTTGRKISTATGVTGDARYSTATSPRFSTATLPGQPGKRISAIVPPGPRVGTNNRPKRISAAPLSAPMPFQAQPNPRLMGGNVVKLEGDDKDTSNMTLTPVEDVEYEELDIGLQSMRANDEEAAYDTIEIHKEPDQTGTGRRRRKKQTNETNTDSCLVAENQYATLDEAEEHKKEEDEKEVKILNTDQREEVPGEVDPDIEGDLAIEDVELAPAEPQPAVSSNTLQMSVAGEDAGDAGTDMVYLPDMGSERI